MNYRSRLIVCLPLTVAIVVLSMVPTVQFTHWEWVVGALTLPVVTWGAWPFHRAAAVNMLHGGTTMDTLVSLGITVSALWSWWVLLAGGDTGGHGHPQIYFEGAAVITLFLLVGRYIEGRTKGAARDALTSLMALASPQATLLTVGEDGQWHEVPVQTDSLEVGDRVLVRPGEKIPADGVVVEGSSAVDAALVTGESIPVEVGVGSRVTGGTINSWGALVLEVCAVGSQTTLAQIGQMVMDAQSGKAQIQRIADAISSVFVPVVIVLAALTAIVWLAVGGGAQAAMSAGVAVLVVACPCALGLATPTALMVGSARAAREGIIVRSVEALESARKLSIVACDKTGTITDGKMSVVAHSVTTDQPDGTEWGEAAQWAALASVEALSEHPIARAIVEQAKQENRYPQEVTSFTTFAGNGVSAVLGDQVIIVGKPAWCRALGLGISEQESSFQTQHEADGATVVMMARVFPSKPILISENSVHTQGGLAEQLPVDEKENTTLEDVEIAISGMTCASCVGRVERKIRKMGGAQASVNLATEKALISRTLPWQPEELIATIEAAGYQANFLGYRTQQRQEAAVAASGIDEEDLRQMVAEKTAVVSAALAVRDTVKADAATAIQELRVLGLDVALVTGDNQEAAAHVAQQTGIDTLFSQVTPADKVQIIRDLQGQGHVVAMVGDGVNDAAGLAQAHLGIAMGSGTDVAHAVSDIILTTSRVSAIVQTVSISRDTVRVIRQNLAWAFGYNIVLIPLAMLGMLNPMLAAGAMSLSSVCVVTNSLRLRR